MVLYPSQLADRWGYGLVFIYFIYLFIALRFSIVVRRLDLLDSYKMLTSCGRDVIHRGSSHAPRKSFLRPTFAVDVYEGANLRRFYSLFHLILSPQLKVFPLVAVVNMEVPESSQDTS